ncbi:MAG: glycosyltransferase, partial [Verrucomicrobiota bacterium]
MILILNQFSENDPAPTSRYLKEWADDLRSQGKKVQWISSSSSYRKSPRFFLFRILRDFSALLGLGIRGITALSPSLIITSSSPPGMLIMATLLKLWHRVPLIHWAMDIHPDLTFALGEKTPFRSFFKKTMALCYPYCDRVLTLDEGMKNHLLKTYHVSALVTPLWPLHEISFFPKVTPLAPPRWTYSGNLGKAHEWITLLETQHELEKRGTPFVLRLQGNAFQRLSLDLFRPR